MDSPLSTALEALLRPDFVSATLKFKEAVRISLRPVEIKGQRLIQISTYDGRKTDVKNYGPDELAEPARQLLEGPLSSIAIVSEASEFHIQFSRKGRAIVHTKKRQEAISPTLSHDRVIGRPFPDGEPNAMLHAIGLMTAEGKVKADRQRKFVQINEFIRIVQDTTDLRELETSPLLIVDFGCGNAYLSFALHHYLVHKLGIEAELIGIDRTAEIIEGNIRKANELGEKRIHFEISGIAEFQAPRPADIVTALHACDTATDAALAKALEYDAELIFAAPCCHHHLQAQRGFLQASGVHRPILRDGILRERLGDLVTDTLRALILRIAGYQVDVIEFTSPEHTAKNLLIRAHKSSRSRSDDLIEEYRELKAEFGVTPYLEELVREDLRLRLESRKAS